MGAFPTGVLPTGYLPTGYLPIGILPIGACSATGCGRGRSAALATAMKPNVATPATRYFNIVISEVDRLSLSIIPSDGYGAINAVPRLTLERSFLCRMWQKRHGMIALCAGPGKTDAVSPAQSSLGIMRPVRAIYSRYSSPNVSSIICSSLATRPKNNVPNPIRPAKPATKFGKSNA
jgi:hypothetical protein